MHGTHPQATIAALLASSEYADRARLRDSDWPGIIETASDAGLGGLILEALRSKNLNAPDFARRSLKRAAQSVTQRNQRMMTRLEPLIAALNADDIPVMLLKGAALNSTAYPSPELRPMSDVDLLIRQRDALRAIEALKKAGCRSGLRLMRRDFFPRFYYETELITDEPDPLRIDLHARPLRPMRYARLIDEDAFWHNAQSIRGFPPHARTRCDTAPHEREWHDLGPREPGWHGSLTLCVKDLPAPQRTHATVLIPAPETMLIHLAAHAAFHGHARLIWLYDLKRWVETNQQAIDWIRLEHLCAQWRLTLAVRSAIEHAESLFGSFVPQESRTRLHAQSATWRDRLTLHQAPRDAASPWLHIMTNLLCTPGLRWKLAYVTALLTPDSAHLADVYPYRHPGWTLAAFAYRILRAAARLCAGVARRTPLVASLFDTNPTRTHSVVTNQHHDLSPSTGGSDASDASVSLYPGM